MSMPVTSKAGRYGVSWAAVLPGAWMTTSGCRASSCFRRSYPRTSPAGRIHCSPRAGLRGSSTPFQTPSPASPARPFTTSASRRSRSDGRPGSVRGGRSVRSPSHTQPTSPCAAAEASTWRSSSISPAIASAPQVAFPDRIMLMPAAATSANPSRPLGALRSRGGPFERQSGNSFRPSFPSAPVAGSTYRTAIGAEHTRQVAPADVAPA